MTAALPPLHAIWLVKSGRGRADHGQDYWYYSNLLSISKYLLEVGSMRSVVGGRELDLTVGDVVRGMRGVEPETIREHFVVIGDKVFPPKQALAQVTGWNRRTFTTMEATRVLGRLGFVCQRAGQRADGRAAWVPEGRTDLEDHGPVSVEERLAAAGVGVRTVGALVERLSNFDSTAPIRVQHGLSSSPDFIIGVGESPDVPGVVAIMYLPPSRSAG